MKTEKPFEEVYLNLIKQLKKKGIIKIVEKDPDGDPLKDKYFATEKGMKYFKKIHEKAKKKRDSNENENM